MILQCKTICFVFFAQLQQCIWHLCHKTARLAWNNNRTLQFSYNEKYHRCLQSLIVLLFLEKGKSKQEALNRKGNMKGQRSRRVVKSASVIVCFLGSDSEIWTLWCQLLMLWSIYRLLWLTNLQTGYVHQTVASCWWFNGNRFFLYLHSVQCNVFDLG